MPFRGDALFYSICEQGVAIRRLLWTFCHRDRRRRLTAVLSDNPLDFGGIRENINQPLALRKIARLWVADPTITMEMILTAVAEEITMPDEEMIDGRVINNGRINRELVHPPTPSRRSP